MGAEKYPIIEKWQEIENWMLDVIEKFPKSTRFTIGTRLVNMVLDVTEKLIEAIYTKNRTHILMQVNIYIEKIRIFNRLCLRRHYYSLKQYEHISTELQSFGSMLGGWIKSGVKK
jgi:flagellar biosynthesis/type III secretory pathway protein FliH